MERCYNGLLKTRLHDALAAATEAEHMVVNFDDYGIFWPAIDLESILGYTVWPKLKILDLDNVSAEEEYWGDSLKRQTSLRHLTLSFATLLTGRWPSLLKSMSTLKLRAFDVGGVFGDPEDLYPMLHVDSSAWGDGVEISMVSTLVLGPISRALSFELLGAAPGSQGILGHLILTIYRLSMWNVT